MKIGIDIGGTFTDCVLFDPDSGAIHKTKVPTTPDDLSECFWTGLLEISRTTGVDLEDVRSITHGSTVAVNTVVEETGATLALITTEGFRDVLGIGTTKRDTLWDLAWKKPTPLIPRHRRYEVTERVAADGTELEPLSEQQVIDVADRIDESVDCIVVFFFNSYADPSHERRAKKLLETHTDAIVIASTDILSTYREIGRLNTAVVNGYLAPPIIEYLDAIETRVRQLDGEVVEPLIATGTGGQIPLATAKAKPGMQLFSGPANGAVGAAFLAERIGHDQLITFDMGGTSCDVSLIRDGSPAVTTDSTVAKYPFRFPMVDINTIASGGGSIAWVDEAGILHVGPESAGADPGPVCYDSGGERPTVTDANLVTGRYNPGSFMGGELPLDTKRAERAIRRDIAEPLGIDTIAAAEGIIDVINAKMADAIKTMTIKRGTDPVAFTIASFGGAGPSHVGFLMDDLDISTVVCSPFASVFSAFGLAINPVQFTFHRTVSADDIPSNMDAIAATFAELKAAGKRRIDAVASDHGDVRFVMTADARYREQRWHTEVPMTEADLDDRDGERVIDRFHRIHAEQYKYNQPDQRVVIDDIHLRAIGETGDPNLLAPAVSGRDPTETVKENREIAFDGKMVTCLVYDGTQVEPGFEIAGPATIEYVDTTIVVQPDKSASVDGYGNVVLTGGAG